MCDRLSPISVYNFLVLAAFSTVLNFDNCQPEVDSDVIFNVVVDPTGMKFLVKFGDSRSNRSRGIRLPHFVTNDDADRRRL